MFSIGEKVVYPGHGVAYIVRILARCIGGIEIQCLELRFINKEMMILVPMEATESVGLRCLSTNEQVDTAFRVLAKPARRIKSYELTASNWNKRNKDYQNKIRNGDLVELSKIYHDLKNIAQQKELSFGEKSLLQQTEALMAEEISIVAELGEEKAIQQLRVSCNHLCHSHQKSSHASL